MEVELRGERPPLHRGGHPYPDAQGHWVGVPPWQGVPSRVKKKKSEKIWKNLKKSEKNLKKIWKNLKKSEKIWKKSEKIWKLVGFFGMLLVLTRGIRELHGIWWYFSFFPDFCEFFGSFWFWFFFLKVVFSVKQCKIHNYIKPKKKILTGISRKKISEKKSKIVFLKKWAKNSRKRNISSDLR